MLKDAQNIKKTQQLIGKVMASVFWDALGTIYIDYFERGKSVSRAKLNELGLYLIPHLRYSPDLVPAINNCLFKHII